MKSSDFRSKAQINESRLTKQIFLRYLLALAGFVVALVLLIPLGWGICKQIIWYENDPLYILLTFVRNYALVFVGMTVLCGWAIITFIFMRRPLRYLDVVISASAQLVDFSDEQQILLPNALKEVQDGLNGIRETARQNARLAKENEQRKNDLIMYLAHDLKTPLSSVIGYLTLLRDAEEISPQLREKYLSITLDKAERLEDLINEFFEITRFNLSAITLQYSRIDLTRLLEQLVFEFKPMLQAKHLSCNLQAPDHMTVCCDADKMQRVFDNLLRNAVIYSFADGEIQIIAEQSEEGITVLFRNQGDTIPHEKLERIFEQFYRLDAARSTNGGAGLGLAIAKQIVELHHGTIRADSADEVITFAVKLPNEGKS